MGMTWTEEQQKVIDLRERNILVSAAAGSGKTAVLVQRILSMLLDKNHPIDVDKLLIMTFTRAAAGEMKSRLTKALEDALSQDPENEHLQKQTSFIHNAQINTIDGFCAYVIRNYFHLIDLDPGYRTADEGEIKLLKADTMKELLEDAHKEKKESFIRLLEAYAPGKTDEAVEGLILKLYEASRSEPWPTEWLDESIRFYKIQTVEEMMQSEWMQILWTNVEKRLENICDMAEKNLDITREPYGPAADEETAMADLDFIEQIRRLCSKRAYDETIEAFSTCKWKALSRKKVPDLDEYKKQQFRSNRDEIKKAVGEIQKNFFFITAEEILVQLKECSEPMQELVNLTKEFAVRFAEKKRKKNVLDFSDMEHFALDILVERTEDGELVKTEAAMELSEKYVEILVDEYQDSNMVQETLMNLVSGWIKEKNNLFMVGDVKQSIYRFRQARPELFMEKLETYSLEDAKEQRVDLSKNFRSRAEVLETVNYLFRKLMAKDLGRVEYDSKAALYPGARYPAPENETFPVTELLLLEKDGPELEEEDLPQSEREMEALAIANKIKQLIQKESVYDMALQAFRPVEYKDIVILLRTASGWTEDFIKILNGQGIPVYTASKTGYFSATEVVTLLNYLKICDNFQQEIPLASVLHSPFAECTAEEMARLKILYPKMPLYGQVLSYLEDKKESRDVLWNKLHLFIRNLEEVKQLVFYTPIHQLILFILQQSGYQDYVSALPAGNQRKANLDMLVEKAQEYEQTSYRGLFNFVRYIESLQKYEVDFGEVNLDAAAQSVQIMTIHKSKGLEFPIVFAAGLGKQFNMQDLNASLLLDSALGIGVDRVNLKDRTKQNTLLKMAIRQKIKEDSLGEELRILYVALTRAKEKLILTGTTGDLEKKLRKLYNLQEETKEILPYQTRISAKTFLDWILFALARHAGMDDLYSKIGLSGNKKGLYYGNKKEFKITLLGAGDLLMQEVEEQVNREARKERLEHWGQISEKQRELLQEVNRRFRYQYPFAYLRNLPVKVSVSEIKKQKKELPEEDFVLLFPEQLPEEKKIVPRFAMEEEIQNAEGGASRGTAYHRALECLDYNKIETEEELREQIEAWLQSEKIDKKTYEYLDIHTLWNFTQSSLGARMKKAYQNGKLQREQPFVMNFSANEIEGDWPKEEKILVQGIMDAWFLEEEDIVLADYKTDRIRSGQEKVLVERYEKQLQYYADALERMTGRKVKEKIIYSLALQKEILISN